MLKLDDLYELAHKKGLSTDVVHNLFIGRFRTKLDEKAKSGMDPEQAIWKASEEALQETYTALQKYEVKKHE